MPFRILFVCSGNTCRSPLAEAIARRELNPDEYEVASAGTGADDGTFASSGSLEVSREHGLDLESFHSRRITPELVEAADAILVMELVHRSGVLGVSPTADTKLWLLGELGGRTGREAAVPDPFGGPLDSYRRTFDRIETYLRDALPRLEEMRARRDDPSAENEVT